MKDKLRQVAWVQKERQKVQPGLIEREVMPEALNALTSDNRVLVITGMRRTGKSTMLRQLMNVTSRCAYLNFEDEKLLDFSVENFSDLEEILLEVYGPSDFLFFDEIQNVERFEIAVRRLQDNGKKIVITGSNSSLLSKEFGTKLTGRYRQIELFPFSFREFLAFKGVVPGSKDYYLPETRVMIKGHFSKWLEDGGLPEFLSYEDPEYVRTLFDNILYRDIIVRYGIRKHRELRELVQLLAVNLSLPITYTSLQKSIGLSNSDTIREYMGYLANSYIFYELRQFHDSLKKQLKNPRKVYLNDPAFHQVMGFFQSQNLGRKLENAVFLHIRKQIPEIYYYKGKGETDFIFQEKGRKVMAIQVCHTLNAENESREIKGLQESMSFFKITEGLILTFDQESEIILDNMKITVLPAWKWMLA